MTDPDLDTKSPPAPAPGPEFRPVGPGHGWYEAPEDEELQPGDLGGGTSDLEADSWLTPPRTRRVPLSFTAVVLLLTLTTGIGMAAGLLTGPNPWHVLPQIGHGPGGSSGPSNGTGGTAGSNGTHTAPGNSTNSTSTNPNGSGGGGHGGNTSGGSGGHSGGNNGTSGNRSGSGGNGTGKGNTTGNGTGGNGTGGSGGSGGKGGSGGSGGAGGNQSRTAPRNTTQNRSVIVYRTILPWLPAVHPDYLLIGGALSMIGLAAAVFAESIRPAPDRGNPWRGQVAAPKRGRSRRRPVSPREALDLAVQRLREELINYTRRYGAAHDGLVRERIIQLYGALLAAFAPGLGDLEGRTPREVEWLAVRYLGVRRQTAHELTWLFEEARYSSHPLPQEGVVRAERALSALITDLESQRLWDN